MGEKKVVSALVLGGEATAGPPLGPTLGPLGVNVITVVSRINEVTKEYAGMRVPVKVTVDTDTKQFEVEVGLPTTSALIVREASIPKGSGNPKAELVADLQMKQVAKIAKLKLPQSYAGSLKSAVKEVVGACVSMGIKVEGKDPRLISTEIDQGKWDSILRE